jgi:hypothetical protein
MSAENTSAAPITAPTAPAAPDVAPADPQHSPAVVQERRNARDSESRPKRLAEKRRVNPNFDAEAWEKAGKRVAEREARAAGQDPAPTKPGVPAKGPDGKFLPRSAKAETAPEAEAKPDPFGKPEPAAEEPVKAKEEPASSDASTPEAKRKQLEALATELGFKLDGKAVTAADRYQLREESRRRQATFEAKMQAERQALEKERSTISEEGAKAKAFLAALEAGDPDGMAKAIGRNDWNAMQEEILARIADPHYNEIQRLRKEIDEDKAQKKKAAEEYQARQAQVERQQAIVSVKRGIMAEASQAKDPVLKAMHTDPLFVDTIFSLQEKNYDPVTQTTISIEEALDEPLPNGQTLRGHMKDLYERLGKAFGQPALPAPRPASAAAPAPSPKRERLPAAPVVATPEARRAPTPEERWRNRALQDAERIARHSEAIKAGI